jgi:hypothetical protein
VHAALGAGIFAGFPCIGALCLGGAEECSMIDSVNVAAPAFEKALIKTLIFGAIERRLL